MKIHKYDEKENEREVKCGQKQRKNRKEKKQDKVSLSPIFTPSRNTYPPWNVYPSSASFVSSTSHRGSQKAQPLFRFDPETPPRPIETKTEERERVRVVQNVEARQTRENKSKRWGRRKRWRRRKDRAREKRNERRSAVVPVPRCIYGHILARPLQDNGFNRGPIKIIQMTSPAVNSIRESPCHRVSSARVIHDLWRAQPKSGCSRFCIQSNIPKIHSQKFCILSRRMLDLWYIVSNNDNYCLML